MELDFFVRQSKVGQERMANEVGVSLSHFNAVVRRKVKPSRDLARRIQEFTRGLVTVEEMIGPELEKIDPLDEFFKKHNVA